VQTQEKIREVTHTKPLVINGAPVGAGSPTNPLTKSANTLSTNTMGSGSHHEAPVAQADPNDANNSRRGVPLQAPLQAPLTHNLLSVVSPQQNTPAP